MICHKTTSNYPQGRTGTYAGASAHKQSKEPMCPPCLESYRQYQANNRKTWRDSLGDDGRKDQRRYDRFRMTREDYETLLEKQGGVCAICKEESRVPLQIDHDHSCCDTQITCGSCVRGLLCPNCNTAIGKMKDDPKRLLAAIKYLEDLS